MTELFKKVCETVSRGFKKTVKILTVSSVGVGVSMSQAQAAVPTEVTTAIADVTATGAAVFAALIVVALPFIAWRLVRKIKG